MWHARVLNSRKITEAFNDCNNNPEYTFNPQSKNSNAFEYPVEASQLVQGDDVSADGNDDGKMCVEKTIRSKRKI